MGKTAKHAACLVRSQWFTESSPMTVVQITSAVPFAATVNLQVLLQHVCNPLGILPNTIVEIWPTHAALIALSTLWEIVQGAVY